MNRIKIDVVSDIVCPWCFVGKRRMEKAITAVGSEFIFDIDYLPFELNPGMENSDTPITQYLADKFGSVEQAEQMADSVAAVAAEEGIEMNFDKINFTANTLLAHELLQLVEDPERKSKLKEALLKAYFTDAVHIGKRENLIKIAAENGFTEEELNNFNAITSTEKVEQTQNELRSQGINAVPSFIINNKYLIQGAQSVETFVEAFNKISNEK